MWVRRLGRGVICVWGWGEKWAVCVCVCHTSSSHPWSSSWWVAASRAFPSFFLLLLRSCRRCGLGAAPRERMEEAKQCTLDSHTTYPLLHANENGTQGGGHARMDHTAQPIAQTLRHPGSSLSPSSSPSGGEQKALLSPLSNAVWACLTSPKTPTSSFRCGRHIRGLSSSCPLYT